MSPWLATVCALALYALGYCVYAKYLARRVFRLDARRKTPAHAMMDGVDYVPTNRFVLFGHHYASITGLAPMLGPAVAVIWGWLPAMCWVVLGAILVGCVHDFGALVVSMRANGQSVGKVAEGVIGPRAKMLFLAIIFFGVALAMGVFVYIIATLFAIGDDFDPANLAAATTSFPSAVLPSAALMVMAMVLGYLLYKRGFPLAAPTAVDGRTADGNEVVAAARWQRVSSDLAPRCFSWRSSSSALHWPWACSFTSSPLCLPSGTISIRPTLPLRRLRFRQPFCRRRR